MLHIDEPTPLQLQNRAVIAWQRVSEARAVMLSAKNAEAATAFTTALRAAEAATAAVRETFRCA